MDLKLRSELKNGHIITNAKELIQTVENGLKAYNYVVTDTTYEKAKKDRTALNKIQKQVSDERKRIEDAMFYEWKQDKKLLMDIEKKIKSSSDELSNGIKDIEYQEKEEKKKQIQELWSTISKDRFKFELVFDEKYLNKTSSAKAIEEDLKSKFKRACEYEGFLTTFLPKDEFEQEQVKEVFYNTLDLQLAKVKADELKKLHEQVDKMIKEKHFNQEVRSEPQKEPVSNENKKDEVLVAFRMKGARNVLKAFNQVLNDFIKNNDVKVEVLR